MFNQRSIHVQYVFNMRSIWLSPRIAAQSVFNLCSIRVQSEVNWRIHLHKHAHTYISLYSVKHIYTYIYIYIYVFVHVALSKVMVAVL